MIKQETIDRIKAASDIVEVIGEYVALRKSGVNYMGCCPFHGEKNPSFSVSKVRQTYKCFSCGDGGDVISFLMKMEGLSYPETIRHLAAKYHIEIEEVEMTDRERADAAEREAQLAALEASQLFFENELKDGSNTAAISYLEGRGISRKTLTEFGAGYAPGQNKLIHDLSGRIGMSRLRSVGVVKEGEHGNYDTFRERITFPFYSVSGKVIGFTGRLLDKDAKAQKYCNTEETELFHKGGVIFGLKQAKREISAKDEVILVEGQFDVMSLYDKGICNAVACSTTSITKEQVKLLLRFTKNVTIMLDGDEPGMKAAEKNAKTLLEEGAKVRVVSLPDGQDPDDFAKTFTPGELAMEIQKRKMNIVDFFYLRDQAILADPYKKEEAAERLCKTIACIADKTLRVDLGTKVSKLYGINYTDLKPYLRNTSTPETWKEGAYGIEEAAELTDEDTDVEITFSHNRFMTAVGEEPVILIEGRLNSHDIQNIRRKFRRLTTSELDDSMSNEKGEDARLESMKELYKGGLELYITGEDEPMRFIDAYIRLCGSLINSNPLDKETFYKRAMEMISVASSETQVTSATDFSKLLGLTVSAYKALLAPYVEKKKARSKIVREQFTGDENLYQFDPERLPDYVESDPDISATYRKKRFYPILNKNRERVAYMFENEKGGFSCVSDFYMVPLLHVQNKDSMANKRIVQLNHMYFQPQYVEWQSNVFANIGKVKEKLIETGAYNFTGTLQQYNKVWESMSYGFKPCTQITVFGEQPALFTCNQKTDFFAFTNAIYHEVDGVKRVDIVDELGTVAHEGVNYYSPAFSKIYAGERKDSDQFEQERYLIYKDIPEEDRIDFKRWSALMDDVYKINDNGKWSVLFAIICAFRDFIYGNRKCFTTLFFIGPTGSGKTQVAFSIRSLFELPDAPTFNLNSGTDAGFFMVLEKKRNIPVIMEEYNENISQQKFQGLKAAVLDGEGRQKVKDMNNKTLDSSKINAVPLLLGQEASQQDDGSLSNRSVIREVPYRDKGEFTEQETEVFDLLKKHEKTGLCNVLIEVLEIRDTVKKYYLEILAEEVKRMKIAVRTEVSNTEGLNRIINSVSMFTAMCRLIEEKTDLDLPFSYGTFFEKATTQVMKQMEMISTSNKLTTYFATIAYLLSQDKLKLGRDLMVRERSSVTILNTGKEVEPLVYERPRKILFMNFSNIYPLYSKSVSDPLSQQSLQSYFRSNEAYIGLCKSAKFVWEEEVSVSIPSIQIKGESAGVSRKMEKRKVNTSSFMFDYENLKKLMDIDFERGIKLITDEEEEIATETQQTTPIREEKQNLQF